MEDIYASSPCFEKKERFMRKFKINLGLLVLILFGLTSSATDLFAQVNRGAGVLQETLPKELKGIEIKDYFVPSSFKKVAVIHALKGNVVVIHRSTNQAYFGKEGDTIYENDSLNTLVKSRCRLRFLGGDVATMASESNFCVERFSDLMREKRSIFSMLKGKVLFYALRLFKHRKTRLTLKTPTAVMGIRGTKFGVNVYWEEEEKRSNGGVRIASRGKEIDDFLVQVGSGGGGKSFTDCFCEDGFLEVNGKTVGPGEMYRGETGAVVPTPFAYIKAFESETEVKNEEETVGEEETEGKGEEKKEQGEEKEEKADAEGKKDEVPDGMGFTDTGEKNDPSQFVDITQKVIDTTQQETGTETESEENAIAQGKTAGWVAGIAAIIADGINGQAYKAATPKGPVYYSDKDNKLTGGAETYTAHEAGHLTDDSYKMTLTEQDNNGSMARVDYLDWGYGEDIHVDGSDFTYFNGGSYNDENSNEYLKWGWWEDTVPTDMGKIGFKAGTGDFYAATSRIWHIEGNTTHEDYISRLHREGKVYDYSGEANGVFADSSGGLNPATLSGPFACQIDFGNKAVNNLDINVSGNGIQVHITGSGTLEKDGSFDIKDLTGTIGGKAVNPPATAANGGCVGGKAEGVGGLWFAHDGQDYWATGEFHGNR